MPTIIKGIWRPRSVSGIPKLLGSLLEKSGILGKYSLPSSGHRILACRDWRAAKGCSLLVANGSVVPWVGPPRVPW